MYTINKTKFTGTNKTNIITEKGVVTHSIKKLIRTLNTDKYVRTLHIVFCVAFSALLESGKYETLLSTDAKTIPVTIAKLVIGKKIKLRVTTLAAFTNNIYRIIR